MSRKEVKEAFESLSEEKKAVRSIFFWSLVFILFITRIVRHMRNFVKRNSS